MIATRKRNGNINVVEKIYLIDEGLEKIRSTDDGRGKKLSTDKGNIASCR